MDKVQAMISSVLHGNICLLTGQGGPTPEADVVRHGQGEDHHQTAVQGLEPGGQGREGCLLPARPVGRGETLPSGHAVSAVTILQ